MKARYSSVACMKCNETVNREAQRQILIYEKGYVKIKNADSLRNC